MNLFPVYPLYDIEPVQALGATVTDAAGRQYLDFYGGHAVISIGHTHPHYVERVRKQLDALAFYSNSVKLPIQDELAQKLGAASAMEDYSLFLCNSGAEANENALKMASFHTGRSKVVALQKSFHGRTSLAVAATDNPAISAPVNRTHQVVYVPINDTEALNAAVDDTVAAVIIEGIQGVGGIHVPSDDYLRHARRLCSARGACLVLDEVQSGYGRTGDFFAFTPSGIKPDLVAVAKGMGNGFPIGGLLIAPHFAAKNGLLGTTFGGNPLACAAALAVLEVIDSEQLMPNSKALGEYLIPALRQIQGVAEVRGRGLMIGVDTLASGAAVRSRLLFEHGIFTGSASTPQTIRLLPPMTVTMQDCRRVVEAIQESVSHILTTGA